jgi:hypothetical protein
LVLPTRVNIINDSSERIKLRIDNDRDRKYDDIINIEPGGRLDGIEGSVDRGWDGSGWDVVVDLVTNPDGPDNNTRLGGFKFDNPVIDYPKVKSNDFTSLFEVPSDYELRYIRVRSESYPKKYWGKLDSSLLNKKLSVGAQQALLINSAPKPTFTIESFFNDSEAGAKVWDLRINSDNFTL